MPELSFLGGPLYRLGCRMGLARVGGSTVKLEVAIGPFAWGVLLFLALMQGFDQKVFSLANIGVHVRLLVAIPLFFMSESIVVPRMAEFVRTIVRSGVVPQDQFPALESEIARTTRWKHSWLPEVICLLLTLALPYFVAQLHVGGATSSYDPSRALAGKTMASWWYWNACLPLFRFLMLRWLWRIALWSYFLWRVAQLELNLVPTHPDGVAGLGFLEVVQAHFAPLVMAISAVQSASFAEDLSAGMMHFEAIYPQIAIELFLIFVLFLVPLFFFGAKLWACRVKGLSDYMEFAARYVNRFDRKWLRSGADPGEPLLGTPDLQSLADLANSISIVRNMRWVPLSPRLVTELTRAALLPMLPLLLLEYPIADLVQKLFTRLSGL